jgi:hypothetical protein
MEGERIASRKLESEPMEGEAVPSRKRENALPDPARRRLALRGYCRRGGRASPRAGIWDTSCRMRLAGGSLSMGIAGVEGERVASRDWLTF